MFYFKHLGCLPQTNRGYSIIQSEQQPERSRFIMIRTHEGANAFEHCLDHGVEFFSKAGSLFVRNQESNFYQGEESALSLFQKVWIVDRMVAMKLLFWLRDCRGGAGNRSGFRACLNWLATQEPEWVKANLDLVPEHGRWDDLRCLFGTPLQALAADLWARALRDGNVLAAKWADRTDIPLLTLLKSYGEISNVATFRKYLATKRKAHIVEHKMCTKEWSAINYPTVPSVAMSRYTKAFGKHDADRFESYKSALQKGEATIHASVLFPHNCVMTALSGDKGIADAQFEALPNYMEGANERIIVISDTSGSMSSRISKNSSVQAVHVSIGLALYCSAKIGPGPFYKKFLGFCSESKFKDWENLTFSQACNNRRIFDGAIGGTRIDTALKLILDTAEFFSLSDDQMPTMLLIVSDMQFHQGTEGNSSEVINSLNFWKQAGYRIPKIVYWNTAGYAGQPSTVKMPNTALISGFSPATLKAIFGGEDFTPRGVMLKAIEKYNVKSSF